MVNSKWHLVSLDNEKPVKAVISTYARNIYYTLKGDDAKTRQRFYKQQLPRKLNNVLNRMKAKCKLLLRQKHKIKISNQKELLTFYTQVIPDEFFGSKKNARIFYRLLTVIATRALHECILIRSISAGYDIECMYWLQNVNPMKRKHMLHVGLRLLLNHIVIPMFKKIFQPVRMGQFYQLKFVDRDKWNLYLMRVRDFLIKTKCLVPVKANSLVKTRGVLQIKPKSDLNNVKSFRPYVIFNSKINVMAYSQKKLITKALYQYAKSLTFVKTNDFGKCWQKYLYTIGDSKLFGVKLDLVNCFSNINLDTLSDILNDPDNKYLGNNTKAKLLFYIKHQYVAFGKRMWLWQGGLLQGDRFSSGLCEVYFAKLDGVHLKDFDRRNCFIHKTVDDYFFCSTEEDDVARFRQTLASYVEINDTKIDDNICDIKYAGFRINLKHRFISNHYRFANGAQMHYKYKYWNRKGQLAEFGLLSKALYFPYNNHYFNKVVLNSRYNSRERILRNYFEAMVLLALKFDGIVMGISLGTPSAAYQSAHFERHISRTVVYYSKKLIKSIELCVKVKIAYAAFLVVLKLRKNKVYNEMVRHIGNLINKIYTPYFNMAYYNQLPDCFKNISLKREFRSLT